eukprot:3122405-Amphidinium_carterae.1
MGRLAVTAGGTTSRDPLLPEGTEHALCEGALGMSDRVVQTGAANECRTTALMHGSEPPMHTVGRDHTTVAANDSHRPPIINHSQQ